MNMIAKTWKEAGVQIQPKPMERSLFYANLIGSFISEILDDGPGNEGNFDDGAWVQETINAVEVSYRQRRWVTLPLA